MFFPKFIRKRVQVRITNEIGPQMDIGLFKVAFKPGKSLNPISDEWGNIESKTKHWPTISGKFGTWTVREHIAGP